MPKAKPVYTFGLGDAKQLVWDYMEAASGLRSAAKTIIGAAQRCETDAQKLAVWDVLIDNLVSAEAAFPKVKIRG